MRYIAIIMLLALSRIGFAQDPQLFENEWYLQKVVIDGVDHFPQFNEDFDYVILGITESFIFTKVCNGIGSAEVVYDNTQIITDNWNYLDYTCVNPDTFVFEDLYFVDFFKWEIPSNTYNYNIVTGAGDSKELTLTNNEGHLAIYGNELLSNKDFISESIIVYPNPTQNVLNIENRNSVEITSFRVYDLLGKVVLEESEDLVKLNLSGIRRGLLFVEIETVRGILIKKIIKE